MDPLRINREVETQHEEERADDNGNTRGTDHNGARVNEENKTYKTHVEMIVTPKRKRKNQRVGN